MTGTNWRRENKRAKIPRESITSVGTHTRKTQHRSARSLTFLPGFVPFRCFFLSFSSGERFAFVATIFLSMSAISSSEAGLRPCFRFCSHSFASHPCPSASSASGPTVVGCGAKRRSSAGQNRIEEAIVAYYDCAISKEKSETPHAKLAQGDGRMQRRPPNPHCGSISEPL